MFCTTVIPTIARPSVNRAVMSVLSQDFQRDEFEVIVVNDSGKPLPEADWLHSSQVRVIDNNRRERIFARNSGAASARGQYIHFLDDDDWLLPGALRSFWELARSKPKADWLYGGSQLVDRKGKPIIRLDHQMNGNCFVQVMAGEWIPLQSSLIRAEAFFATGGFTPLVFATQDVDLLRKIALRGDLAGTEALVSCIGMGTESSSTDYDRAPEYSRWAREKILNESGVFSRLQESAHAAHWKARVVRIYLTSLVWNLQNRMGFTAASRGMFTLAAMAAAGPALLAPSFWRALRGRYISPTFTRGFESAGPAFEHPAGRRSEVG